MLSTVQRFDQIGLPNENSCPSLSGQRMGGTSFADQEIKRFKVATIPVNL